MRSSFLIWICLLVFSCGQPLQQNERANQEKYFINRFGIALPADVKEVLIKDSFMRDSWILYMKFTYTDSVYKSILESNFQINEQEMSLRTKDKARHLVHDVFASKPDWMPISSGIKYHIGPGLDLEKGNWNESSEVMWRDEERNYIYYMISATDF